MRSQRNFENRQLTGGRGGRGFYGQHADNSGVDEQNQQTPPFIPGRGRGFSSSTFSVGYPSNVSVLIFLKLFFEMLKLRVFVVIKEVFLDMLFEVAVVLNKVGNCRILSLPDVVEVVVL